jgi:amino acid efflux transporter
MAELARTLTVWRGTAILLNIVLGAGLLTLPGLAIGAVGASAPLVWLACALVSVPLLIVFARLGSRFPGSGGIASFAAEAFGLRGRSVATFLLLGAVILGLPSIALIGGHYAATLIAVDSHLAAGLLLLAAALPNLLSPGRAGRVQGMLATVLLLFFCVVILACGLALGDGANPGSATGLPQLPTVRIFVSVFLMVFFAFTGWELGAGISAEFHNPVRDFPLAICMSFLAVVALYLGLTLLLLAIDLTPEQAAAPLVPLTYRVFGGTGEAAVSIAAVVLVLANLSAAIWAVSRLLWSSAGDGLLPRRLASLHHGAPLWAVAVTLIALSSALALSGAAEITLATFLEFAGQNFFLLYAVAALVLFRRRAKPSDAPLALVAVVIVLGLLALRPPVLLLYPALCVALGLLAARHAGRRREASLPHPVQPTEGKVCADASTLTARSAA